MATAVRLSSLLRGSQYWPHDPSPKQAAFLSLYEREVFFGGAAGGGKELALDTRLPTPTGWTTMGDVRVGDALFDADGQPCRVTHVHQVDLVPECYRLRFDDGTVIEAGANHRWLTMTAADLAAATRRTPEYRARRRESRGSSASGRKSEAFSASLTARNATRAYETLPVPVGDVRDTAEIARTLTVRKGRANHAIPTARPLELPEADLPLDPYLLGVWLGDGTTRAGSVTTADIEVAWAFDRAGFTIAAVQDNLSRARSYSFLGLRPMLRKVGVFGNKHVPTGYLRGSASQRLALLQGLMDTDGHAKVSGSVEFTTTCYPLAEGVADLVHGLGWKARIVEGRATLKGRDIGPKWRLTFTPSSLVFRLARKAERQRLERRRTTSLRYVVACERIRSKPMRCISVDSPSHLYLAGDAMVPTHNSDALLMGALQFVDEPGYAALLLRRTYKNLSQAGALMDRASDWLAGTLAHWSGKDHRWTFPGGALIEFGHLQNEQDKFNYASSEYQYIGFDELTEFTESQYRFLFSRLRRRAGIRAPLRMRSASNPGGIGHDWVKRRFIDEGRSMRRLFISSRLTDNPGLNAEEYGESLAQLDPVTRAQLLSGDWSARSSGGMFRRERFIVVEPEDVPEGCRWVRRWDMAATEVKPGREPDYTVGTKMGTFDGLFYVGDVNRFREEPDQTEKRIARTAYEDGRQVAIRMEQEPGSSGKFVGAHFARRVLSGYDFKAIPSTGSKVDRARPYAAAVGNGLVRLVRGPWITAYLDELDAFPLGSHDDQVDSSAGAYEDLVARREQIVRWL